MNNSVIDIVTTVLSEAGYKEVPKIPTDIKIVKKTIRAWISNEDGTAYINFEYKGEYYKTNLRGTHQAVNCAYAIEVFYHLNKNGYKITREHIDNGFVRVPLNGRFETIQKKPLVIFNAAVSTEDIKNFVKTVDEYFGRAVQKSLATPQNLHPKPFKKLIIYDCDFGLEELIKIKQNVTIIFTSEQVRQKYLGIYNGIVKTMTMGLEKAIPHATKNFAEHKIFIVGSEKPHLCISH